MGSLGMGRVGMEGSGLSTVRAAIKMVLNKADGTKVNLNQAVDSVVAYVESKDLDMGDPRAVKMIDMAIVKVTDAVGIGVNGKLIIKYRENLEEPLQIGDTINLSDANAPLPVKMPDAPYIRIRLEDAAVKTLWKFAGLELWGTKTGDRF